MVPKAKDWVLFSEYKYGLPDIIKDWLEYGDKDDLVLIPEEKWKLYPKVNKLLVIDSACKFYFQ
jgi:hypothetical protein